MKPCEPNNSEVYGITLFFNPVPSPRLINILTPTEKQTKAFLAANYLISSQYIKDRGKHNSQYNCL